MAELFINNTLYKIEDHTALAVPCAEAGVPFNCNSGICGSCLITVEEGEENLTDLTEEEIELGCTPQKRLSCLCQIKTGKVKITF